MSNTIETWKLCYIPFSPIIDQLLIKHIVCIDEFGNSTMAKLTNFLDNKYACETMAVIFHAASNDSNDNWIQRKVAGPLNGQLLIKGVFWVF